MDKITPSLQAAIKQQRKRLRKLRRLREAVAYLDQRRRDRVTPVTP